MQWFCYVVISTALILAPGMCAAQRNTTPVDRPPRIGGRLDLRVDAPDPAVALSRSLVLPGSGWAYLSGKEGGSGSDWIFFMAHMAATVSGIVIIKDGTRRHEDQNVVIGCALVGVSRFIDIWGVASVASDRRDGTR